MSKTRLIFRADGNSLIGLGHVIRSLALAELLNDEFECSFAIQNPSETLKLQLQTVCETIINLPENRNGLLKEAASLADQLTGHEIIVIDGYQFTTEYQQALKQKGSLLVCLDDLHDRHFVADAIINIAGGVNPEAYSAATYTKLCLGPEYALLRLPFREAQKTLLPKTNNDLRVLVCFGGADPEDYTLEYVRNLLGLGISLQLEIVTGSAYQHSEALDSFLAGKPEAFRHKNLSAEQMAGMMQQCSVAVCSASSVAYEYCAVTGLLFLVQTADNQNDIYNFLISVGLALPAEEIASTLNLPELSNITENMRGRQRKVFNGQAETNLRELFQQLNLQAQLTFRKVNANDVRLLFDWANDPVVRQFSFNTEPILFETHQNWLNGKLANPDALLLLAEIENQPAALLRFDRDGNTALISYQIGAEFRGKGLGHRVLQLGLLELKKHFSGVNEAIGYVQPQNIASVRAFEKAEFVNLGADEAQHGSYKFIAQVL